jgi:hypothetical protein
VGRKICFEASHGVVSLAASHDSPLKDLQPFFSLSVSISLQQSTVIIYVHYAGKLSTLTTPLSGTRVASVTTKYVCLIQYSNAANEICIL